MNAVKEAERAIGDLVREVVKGSCPDCAHDECEEAGAVARKLWDAFGEAKVFIDKQAKG